MMRWSLALGCTVALVPVAVGADPTGPVEFFENKVRPVLAEHCYSCHGPKKQNAGLRLDTATGVRQGADAGPVIVPGDPARSKLVQAVKRVGDNPMPPKAPLPAEAAAVLEEWVKLGAPYPDDLAKGPTTGDPKNHWAFQPVRDHPIPELRDPISGIRNPIDAFVLARLAEKGLSLAPPADKRTLIRRAYLDLIGLPPTAEEVEAFENDTSPDAFEKVIDKLLASPHYGERWGRYWLDVARYADTKGYVFNEDRNYPFAYTYRDYVIRSFNEDKPFDRFVIEQLAADKLPLGTDRRPLAALGFLTLGRRFLNNQQDIIDDRIDVVTRGLMGLTVQCARCHDHKFDPVPIKDYYSLYGVFASSVEPRELPLIGEVKRTPEVIAFEKELAKREEEMTAFVERRHAEHMKKLRTAESVADYLRAYLDARGRADGQLQGFLRDRDLSRYVFDRWRTFLNTELKGHSPVFSPLVALAAIPEAEFEKKTPEVIAGLGLDPQKPINPLVLKALTETEPKTLKDAVTAVAGVIAAHAALVGPPTRDGVELVRILGPGSHVDIPLSAFDQIRNRADRDQMAAIQRKIDSFKATHPAAPPRAMALADAPNPVEPVVFLRGNPNNRGPAVPRQFPEVLAGPSRKPFADGSGRLDLAKAIVSPDNPLTARVFVNRVWGWHFGQGLVRTPSDFGTRSEPPTHPELLDWLARRFVADGWSIKRLHKLIMLSATYRQSSVGPAELYRLDPENRLLGRQNRRRLDFEALRDSMLFVSGKLDPTAGGKAVDLFKAPFSTRRTVYGVIDRSSFASTLRAFDVPSPDQHSPQRFQTTVPQQALFLMNSPFVTGQARALANRPEVNAATTADEKVTRLYRAALGRNPTTEELAAALEFVAEPGHWLARAAEAARPFGKWPQLAQVLLLSNEFAFAD
jgi:hypothetical protein